MHSFFQTKKYLYCRNVAIFQVEKIANYGDFFSFPAQFSLSLCVSVLSVKNAPFDMARSITISVHWGYIKKKKVAIRKYHRGWNSGGGGCHDVPSCVRIFSKVVTSEWHVWYVRILYFLDMEKMSYFWWMMAKLEMDSLY